MLASMPQMKSPGLESALGLTVGTEGEPSRAYGDYHPESGSGRFENPEVVYKWKIGDTLILG